MLAIRLLIGFFLGGNTSIQEKTGSCMEARLSGPQNNKMADRKAEIKEIFGKGKDMDIKTVLQPKQKPE